MSQHAADVVHEPPSAGKVLSSRLSRPNHAEAAAAAAACHCRALLRRLHPISLLPRTNFPGQHLSPSFGLAVRWVSRCGLREGRLLCRMRNEAQPAPRDLVDLMDRVIALNRKSPRHVDLLVCSHIEVAVALGIMAAGRAVAGEMGYGFPLPLREGLGEGSNARATYCKPFSPTSWPTSRTATCIGWQRVGASDRAMGTTAVLAIAAANAARPGSAGRRCGRRNH